MCSFWRRSLWRSTLLRSEVSQLIFCALASYLSLAFSCRLRSAALRSLIFFWAVSSSFSSQCSLSDSVRKRKSSNCTFFCWRVTGALTGENLRCELRVVKRLVMGLFSIQICLVFGDIYSESWVRGVGLCIARVRMTLGTSYGDLYSGKREIYLVISVL